jgi:intracellular septation protein A
MHPRIRALLGLLHTFGGLIAFYVALRLWGLKPAIGITLVFVLVDGAYRLLRRKPMPLVWLVSNAMALAFGCIDLVARTPFMLRYEAPITNLLVGLFFLVGAAAEKPLVIQYAEQSGARVGKLDRPELVAYFRALTLAWAATFFLRSGLFLWIGLHYPFDRAMTLRLVVGWLTIGVMTLVSFKSRPVFALCQRFGLFRPAPAALPSEAR